MTRILDINPSYTQTVILDNDSDADLTQVNRDMRITQQAISLRTCKYLHRSRSTLQQTEYPIFYKCQCAKTIQIIAIDHQKKSRIQITTTPGLVLTPLKYLILLALFFMFSISNQTFMNSMFRLSLRQCSIIVNSIITNKPIKCQ